ncbi:uncharacterized protein STEHIDRAFT_139839 [Stereum hirsutum FP-91666 SS1]|uniref:uncharacterized protein n=1 Tax=Stereum hirsutum (strain FP-91666) TaxID=721885 RepID=UPI000444A54B|nr:uncharacterized protein STEHIDRAFT_139839 [Stereum hirsutum FP-91666 SS1]EIM86058.1 hypothetical protein STEHIDRAFT_139839 [Stereum hirsutum FP-91666 SS1]
MASDLSRANFWQNLRSSRIPETIENAGGDVGMTLQACDDEIARACAYIQEISARRNKFVPILRLPSEILASIFRHLLPVLDVPCWSNAGRRDLNEIEDRTKDLIVVSHTCKLWRQTALEFSVLWTTIWISNTHWMKEMLDRSKDAPLTIVELHPVGWRSPPPFPQWTPPYVEGRQHNIEYIVPKLFESKQVKVLSLSVPLDKSTELWREVLKRPAPQLETLELYGMLSPDPSPFSIPEDFLGGYAPALRGLALDGYFSHEILWRAPMLHGLVTLKLIVQFTSDPGSNCVVLLQDTLDALRNMQQLETLFITFPSSASRSTYPTYFVTSPGQVNSPVDLPRLSSLTLAGNLADITELTTRIVVDPSAILDFDIILGQDELNDSLSERLSGIFCTPAITPIECLELVFFCNTDDNLILKCWNQSIPTHFEEIPKPDPQITLHISILSTVTTPVPYPDWSDAARMREHAQGLIRVLSLLSSLLPLDHLHDLRWGSRWRDLIMATIPFEERTCVQALDIFSTVQRLVLEDVRGYREILAATASNISALPRLNSIHFDPTVMARQHWHHSQSLTAEEAHELAELLRRVVEKRDLRTLEFCGAAMDKDYLSVFENSIPRVFP